MRPIQWHLKNNWRVPESLEKVIPLPKSLHPHLRWWLEESNVLLGQPLHPLKHALQIFTDASKEGHSLRRAHCKGNLVPSREQAAHKPLRAENSISSSKRVSNPRLQQDSIDSYRQHNSGCLYQQRGGGDEVRLTVCPTVENPVLVYQTAGNPQGTSHPRPAEHDSRQAIQTWPDHSNSVVTSSRSVPSSDLNGYPDIRVPEP